VELLGTPYICRSKKIYLTIIKPENNRYLHYMMAPGQAKSKKKCYYGKPRMSCGKGSSFPELFGIG
jgi:hypothetical protein